MTFTESPSANLRDIIISEIRDHLTFLRDNGGTADYSYEKVALFLNKSLGTKFDKGDARRFLIGENKLTRQNSLQISELLRTSRLERTRVENQLSQTFHSVVVCVPLTPALVEVFAKHAELLLLVDPRYVDKVHVAMQEAGHSIPNLEKKLET
ncbi:MAG: hypothetical protein AUJ12_04470 [Alphaproteobacteria bacterium CG1_02_46_17]|nr:MAG: hypothetical protein AUJ12_04470 [Alphaproteobacteria bacterium CG1_02_46_17]